MKRPKVVDAEGLFSQAEKFEDAHDFKNAFKCLVASSHLGNVMSQINLGNFYARGRGTSKNLERAAYWYRRAYKSGFSDGALNLAIERRNEGRIESAILWLKRAIAMRNPDACIELARLYSKRRGGHKIAIRLLKQAVRLSRGNRPEFVEYMNERVQTLLEHMAKEKWVRDHR